MNRIYRLVWSQNRHVWMAVAENAKGRGKSGATRKLIAGVLAVAGGALLAPLVLAAPVDGQVSVGAGSIAQAGANTTITQSSQNLAINWQGFSIAANEAVRFNQPNASAIALNRVLGQSPSEILGSLSANGQVFVLNPNGVLFGAASQVNVGGLVASTLNLSDADFLAGKHSFGNGGAAGSVVNQGTLTAAQGGYIALLAPEVRNEGVISATLGTALLAAGDKVTLNLSNGSLLAYSIDQGALNALADNKHLIQADGGQIFMSAKAANALSTAMVNNTGIIEARTVQEVAGVIKLMGDMQVGTVSVGGTLDASAPNGGNGGFVETSAAHVNIANDAKVTTASFMGLSGTWLIDPTDYTIAAVDPANGSSYMSNATLATSLGNGNVTIQTLSGGTGNGDIFVNGAVSWSANNTLTLSAYRNINVNSNITATGNTAGLTLTPSNTSAGGSYYLNNGSVIALSGSTPSLIIAGNAYTVINETNGGVTTLQNMSSGLSGRYALGSNIDASATNTGFGFVPVGDLTTKFTGTFDGLGHTVRNLTINRPTTDYVGLFGYTSGSTIQNVGMDGGSVSGKNQVGGLVGRNDYGTISNSYSTGSVSGSTYVGGLVGLAHYGNISNAYATGSVSGSDVVGGLMGHNNYGTVSNAYTTGSVNGVSSVGGLLGNNYGTVSNVYAKGSVSGTTDVGGLVGYNNNYGHISNAYATGSVSGSSHVGGLVGYTYSGGTVSNSYWDTQTTGQTLAVGLDNGTTTATTGLTTAQMMLMTSFAGYDIANTGGSGAVWRIYEGSTTPWLTWFLTPLTVTATSGSKVYDGTAAGIGVNYSLTPDMGLLLGTMTNTAGGVNVGSYSVSPGGLHSIQQGYDISYANGTLTIDKAQLTVTADDKSRLYGQANPTLTTTVSGFVNGETAGTAAGFTGAGSATTLAGATTNVGTALITGGAGSLAATNYDFTAANGTLTIDKAQLTVTADDKSRLYGQANPTLTTTVSGFVNGETAGTAAGFTGAGSATTLAGATTNVGTALITGGAGNLAATNYAFTNLIDGTLTITQTSVPPEPVPSEPLPVTGILPTVVAAITALPGGAGLLPAFSSTVTVAAALVDANAPPIALSNLQYVYLKATPGATSTTIVSAADATVPTKAQGTQSDGFNERLVDSPIQFSGTVLVRNGGIALPRGVEESE